MERERKYWVVSPNVNNRKEVLKHWRREILMRESAYMGYGKDHPIGLRFANEIKRGDIVLIARRHNGEPQIIGFGVATGELERSTTDLRIYPQYRFKHKLKPFQPGGRAPMGFIEGLRHTMALVRLHPESNRKHRQICNWMEQRLTAESQRLATEENRERLDPRLKELQHQDESDYQRRSQREIAIATRDEAALINEYIDWLKRQGRKLHIARYGGLHCDAFEEERNNLIEAKRSGQREHIRMAVGQLLDYAFQGRNQFGQPHLAILLPEKPRDSEERFGWLKENGIHLVWKDGEIFLDDDDGQFS